jgi:hypothetical protein
MKFLCSARCNKEDQKRRQTGKKRPEHSAYMKQLAKSGTNTAFSSTLIKPRQLFNKAVNTDDFKRKCLLNAGVRFTESDLDMVYSIYQNDKVNNVKVFRKKIVNAIKKYPEHQLISFLRIAAKWSDVFR